MLSQPSTVVIAIISFTHLIKAFPSSNLMTPYPESVLYSWSTEPSCNTTARKTDCEKAFTSLCARAHLGVSENTTVGDCTALYWFDLGNTKPNAAQCTAAYTQILTASIGGALGYNASKARTNDPLYAIYPKNGNGNCLKAAGDTSPVLAIDALPDGGTLATCPTSTSRRRRALERLERRDQAENATDESLTCFIEDVGWGLSCTAVCLVSVAATSWLTGPFAAAGWLGCLGLCDVTATKVYNNCQKSSGHPEEIMPLNPLGKRQEADESSNPCVNIKQWRYSCPAQETGLLQTYNCPATINS